MSDAPVSACEVCGAGPVEKLLFPVAVHFKGKGFYSTDYGRGSRGPGKDGDSASSTTESASGDAGSGGDKKASTGDTSAKAPPKTD